MIMKCSLKRNLFRCLLTLGLFAFLVTLFIFSLKENNENGRKTGIQSVAEKENSFKISQFLRKRNDAGSNENNTIGNRRIKGFEPRKSLVRKEIVQDDADIETQSLPLDVYVFEEHHEALPYWFGSAYNGTISKTGNTLIHIDGHSDLAPPTYFPGYPFFRWPTEDQIRLLMQRNDAFIQSSIMAGLVTRMIWVWPEWDRKNHEKDYVMSTVKLGWTLANSTESNKLEMTFCMCQKTEVKIECMYPKDRDENGVEEVMIDSEKCHIKKTILVEEINEAMAVSFLNQKQKEWIQKSESVILDIDEDFFGCSYVIKPLLDANVSADSLKMIEENLRRIVCPKSTPHETNTNKIMLEIVSLLILKKSCQTGLKSVSECKDSKLDLNPDMHLVNLLTTANNRNETNLCIKKGKQPRFTNFVKRFIIALSKLTAEQLQIIHQIGFCATTTPKTLDIYGLPEFGLCYGANTPLESAVTEFNPSFDDIKKRSVVLRSIIQNSKRYSPKFITLCRSMRDGYTPRQFFTIIENEILTSLKDAFPNISLHYDEDLLDGKAGRANNQHV